MLKCENGGQFKKMEFLPQVFHPPPPNLARGSEVGSYSTDKYV